MTCTLICMEEAVFYAMRDTLKGPSPVDCEETPPYPTTGAPLGPDLLRGPVLEESVRPGGAGGGGGTDSSGLIYRPPI